MKKIIALVLLLAYLAASNQQLKDEVECLRIQDSSFAHFYSCASQKPMPLKVQSTFIVDKPFTWIAEDYAASLYNTQYKTVTLLNCIQGRPSPGAKTQGQNLTLSTMCDRLARPLQQYDVIRYGIHFPNLDWLIWGVPIPGFSTAQDVKNMMNEKHVISQAELIKADPTVPEQKSENKSQKSLLSKLMILKHLRKSQ